MGKDGIQILIQKRYMLLKGSNPGCNRWCGTQQTLKASCNQCIRKKWHVEGEKFTPKQWKFERPPRILKVSHFISPIWMTWDVSYCFLFTALTHPLRTWDTLADYLLETELRAVFPSFHRALPQLLWCSNALLTDKTHMRKKLFEDLPQ